MIHRGIVIVHGIGNQRHGDELDDVVEPLVEFLGLMGVGHPKVHVVASNPRERCVIASARIQITQPNETEPQEEWHFREAWWAQIFQPSGASSVLPWAVRAFFSHIDATWKNIFWRNLKRSLGHQMVQGEGVWTVATAGSL